MRYSKIALFLAAILAILATLFIRAEGSYAAAPASCGTWSMEHCLLFAGKGSKLFVGKGSKLFVGKGSKGDR